MLDKNHTEVEH